MASSASCAKATTSRLIATAGPNVSQLICILQPDGHITGLEIKHATLVTIFSHSVNCKQIKAREGRSPNET